MVHPEHRTVRADETEPSDRLTPVYPTTEGLHQQSVRRLVGARVAALEREALDDYLAPALASHSLAGEPWPPLADALRYLHSPPRDAATELLLVGAASVLAPHRARGAHRAALELAAIGRERRAPSARGRCPTAPRGSTRFAPRCRSR